MIRLYQVTAPHFCAGIVVDDHVCLEAALILDWAVGKKRSYLRRYFHKKQWQVCHVEIIG